MPHELSPKNLQDRLTISTEHFLRFKDNPGLFNNIITADETWIIYANVVRKSSWVDKNAKPATVAKGDLHLEKRMVTVFWDVEGDFFQISNTMFEWMLS